MNIRKEIAKILYPEVFDYAKGMAITCQDLQAESDRFKIMLEKGKGIWITLTATYNVVSTKQK